MSIETIPIIFDKSHILTIGERLYSTSLDLIRELVSNAYDADATEVAIEIKPERIVVADNGSGMDEPAGITVDLFGRAHIVGGTDSADLSFTEQLGQPGQSPSQMFVLRLTPTGAPRDVVGIGGGSFGATPTGIALDGFGRVHISGYTSSQDFPTMQGSLGPKPFGGVDAFLMRLSNFALR